MNNEGITITFPAIPVQVIAELQETETLLAATEVQFIQALRERFAGLAKYNGFIKTSHYGVSTSNYRDEGDTYLSNADGKIKGLLTADGFSDTNTSQNDGTLTGAKLYLTGSFGWVEVTRAGHWTQWQGSPTYWTCDGSFAVVREIGEDLKGYGIRWMSDEEVASEYDMPEIAQRLSKSLSELARKLPQRLTKKRALAESLTAAVAALNS